MLNWFEIEERLQKRYDGENQARMTKILMRTVSVRLWKEKDNNNIRRCMYTSLIMPGHNSFHLLSCESPKKELHFFLHLFFSLLVLWLAKWKFAATKHKNSSNCRMLENYVPIMLGTQDNQRQTEMWYLLTSSVFWLHFAAIHSGPWACCSSWKLANGATGRVSKVSKSTVRFILSGRSLS